METTCTRCHNPVEAEDRYCAACGLPQLVFAEGDEMVKAYAAEGAEGDAASGRLPGPERVLWRPALKVVLPLAVPAGILCSGLLPVGGLLNWLWMALAAAWAVSLYARAPGHKWLSAKIGARIGLVTGLVGGWLAVMVGGLGDFVSRYVFHRGAQLDSLWLDTVEQAQQLMLQLGMSDKQMMAQWRSLMLSPEGHAGVMLWDGGIGAGFLLICAVAGGALGARLIAKPRAPQA